MEASNCCLASQCGTITYVAQTAISTIVVATKAESAIREMKQGEELNTYFNEDFFGGNSKFCLAGHVSKPGIEAEMSEDREIEVVIKPSKQKLTLIPGIKVTARDVRSSLLNHLIKCYSEDSSIK